MGILSWSRSDPVSRSAAEVQGLKAYPSVEALPQVADLALLIVPAEYVPAELDRCGRAGVRAAVILGSGFAEVGEAGQRLQHEIVATARRYDMAVSGPNTEGFSNIAASLCANFSPASDKSAGPLTPSDRLAEAKYLRSRKAAVWICLPRSRPPALLQVSLHRDDRQRGNARDLRFH